MFGRKRKRDDVEPDRHSLRAVATVVSATYVSSLDEWNTSLFDFTVDVTPEGAEPFRQTVRQKALSDQHPKPGETLTVAYDPTSHDVVLDLDGDPRYRPQSHEEAEAFNQRFAADLDEVKALEKTGRKATAVIGEVTECGWMRSLGQREFAVVADVSPADGSSFTARFSIFDAFGHNTPTVDQTIGVVYDEADPPMVRAGTFWDNPVLEVADFDDGPVRAVLRWTVPAECPQCGAPVDQSRASVAAHPTCQMCHTPLPCEPA